MPHRYIQIMISQEPLPTLQHSPSCLLEHELHQALLYGPSLGLYLFPSIPGRWQGLMFLRHGCLRGARLGLTLDLEAFPQVPRLFLSPAPLHPLVDPVTGELDVAAVVDWDGQRETMLYQFLGVLPRALTEQAQLRRRDSYNPEAATLFTDNYREFALQALRSIEAPREADLFCTGNAPLKEISALKQQLKEACQGEGDINTKVSRFLALIA